MPLKHINRSELSESGLLGLSARDGAVRFFRCLDFAVTAGISFSAAFEKFDFGSWPERECSTFKSALAAGEKLSAALGCLRKRLPEDALRAVELGEANDRLPEVLHVLARQMSFGNRLLRRLTSLVGFNLLLPLWILMVCSLFYTFIYPRVQSLCAEVGGLSVPSWSDPLTSIISPVTQFLSLLFMIWMSVYTFSPSSRAALAKYILRFIPGFRGLVRMLGAAEFSRAMSSFLAARCDWSTAVKLSCSAGGIAGHCRGASPDDGEPFSALCRSRIFTPFELWMIHNSMINERPEDGFLLVQQDVLCRYGHEFKALKYRIEMFGLALRALLVGFTVLIFWTLLVNILWLTINME